MEEDIIVGFRNDRESAWKDFIKIAKEKEVKKYILERGGQVADAEDIFHDALIAFYVKCQKEDFRLEKSIDAYVFGIARNLWRSRLREQKKKPRNPDQKNTSVPPKDVLLEQLEIKKRKEQALKVVWEKLPPNCKKILEYRYYFGWSIEEIRERMNHKNKNVTKSGKKRCLNKLKDLFLDKYDKDSL